MPFTPTEYLPYDFANRRHIGPSPKEMGEMLEVVGAKDLAAGDSGRFLNAVALRVAPPRSSTTVKPAKPGVKDKPTPKPQAKAPEPDPVPEASPLQKLIDKFR